MSRYSAQRSRTRDDALADRRQQLKDDNRADLRRLGNYEQVLQKFKSYDVDGNGIMSFKELHRLMKDINRGDWTEDESDKLFSNIDKNGNGAIDINEFLNFIFTGTATGETGLSEYEKVMEEFRKFDYNRNGTLDKTEFTRVMMSLKPDEWTPAMTQEVFRHVDTDRSGEVDLAELVAYLFKVPAARVKQAKRSLHGKEHGPLVVIEFTCGPGGPEVAVQQIANSWGKRFGSEVAVLKVVDKTYNTIGKVTTRDGEVVLWDYNSMVAFRENPFLTMTSMRDWQKDMSRRHIPRLIEGAHDAMH